MQTGSKHLLMHLGQSTLSQPLSGHLISQTGGSHYTSQLANLGVEQLGVQRGGSQIGSQTAKLLLMGFVNNMSGLLIGGKIVEI